MHNNAPCKFANGNTVPFVWQNFTTVTLLDGVTVIEINGKHASQMNISLEKCHGLHTVCAQWEKWVQ